MNRPAKTATTTSMSSKPLSPKPPKNVRKLRGRRRRFPPQQPIFDLPPPDDNQKNIRYNPDKITDYMNYIEEHPNREQVFTNTHLSVIQCPYKRAHMGR